MRNGNQEATMGRTTRFEPVSFEDEDLADFMDEFDDDLGCSAPEDDLIDEDLRHDEMDQWLDAEIETRFDSEL
jgi:hypothetical protein